MRFTTREHYEIDWTVYIKCNKCWQFRNSDLFTTYKNSNAFMNKGSYCKECRAEYRKANRNREHEYRKAYNIKNRDATLEKKRIYNKEHSKELLEKSRERIARMWYWPLHKKTTYTITKLGIRPTVCPICWWDEYKIDAHHPNNDIWNEIVFCCKSCHSAIHNWFIECPQPINLLLISMKETNEYTR